MKVINIKGQTFGSLTVIERIENNKHEKAAWNIFGKSYEYRQKYNEYKARRMDEEKEQADQVEGQMSIFDLM